MAVTQQTIVTNEQNADTINILERYPFIAVPITLDFVSAFSGAAVIPAGYPITADGGDGAESGAAGILLHDVYPDYPIGSIVVEGFINVAVAEAHISDVTSLTFTYADDVTAALPNVHFGLAAYAPAE